MSNIDMVLMKEVAGILGYQLKKLDDREDSWRCYLVTPQGGEIFVNATWGKNGMYYVSGSYPRDNKNSYVTIYEQVEKTRSDGTKYMTWDQMKAPEIQFSISKGAEKIAKDIKSRFIPAFEKYSAAVLKKIEENNNYNNSMQSALKTVASALGETVKEGQEQIWGAEVGSADVRDVQVQSSGSEVKMTIECPMDVALKIFDFLKTTKKAEVTNV